MFYSETLLSKTGPLARVWLAANLERKLSKSNILQSNIESSVSAIVDQGQAPMALRLSGQLLLGVVRIYSRKARYLLDDCNEALMKIKMAFRPGNVDLPANQSHAVNPATLTLPDVLTELDLLAPMPDPSLLLSQPLESNISLQDNTLLDWNDSQLLSGSIEQPRGEPIETLQLEEVDDLNLDLGEDLDTINEGTSIERPRDAPPARRASEEFGSSPKPLEDDGIMLDIGDEPDTSAFPAAREDLNIDDDMDVDAGDAGELGGPIDEDGREIRVTPDLERRQRDTLSPLSSIRSSVERDLEQTFQQDQSTTAFEPEEELEESVHQAHKAKRRKVLHADADTEIHSSQIRAQQNDRSRILKPASFLPRDPMLLALINMQKNGGFVSSILGEGRSQGWAPELRGILSLEVVRRSGELKRKRDSGVADLSMEEESEAGGHVEKTPQLQFEQDELDLGGGPLDVGADTTLGVEGEVVELADDAGLAPLEEEGYEGEALSPVPENFDDTTAPLLHPADSGPVSLGTKHAVHLLRERFGSAAAESDTERQKTSVLFQDMLPEATTTRTDATKMFFEVLVLATKDAIKVEQPVDQLGGPLRIRGKRGLWGSWAETQAGGEMASQSVPAPGGTTVI
ncbi:hypothetical protein AOQ84DRAFT_340125 [Glonium stellatum]|uniref:Double-strand-break repair protein rad21 n=1 Tax=Glonium stellatum TaxID=574774 RepID=A0A8E2F169_9PEZI|nr:hypothetical protein AOQ84DRAFT_340125 [Glonium stellatum]